MLARAWKKGKPHAPLVGTKVFATSKEYNMEIPQKLKKQLPYNPAISLLDIYLKKMKRPIQKDTCTYMFIVALFIVARF